MKSGAVGQPGLLGQDALVAVVKVRGRSKTLKSFLSEKFDRKLNYLTSILGWYLAINSADQKGFQLVSGKTSVTIQFLISKKVSV